MKSKQFIKLILKEELSKILNEDFKSQRINFLSQIESPDAEAIVDRYLNDFKEIKDKKYAVAANADLEGLNVKKGNDRFDIDKYKTFKELETLIDYVSGQVRVGSANFEDIKVDGKPIYEDKEVEIYYAETPRACIQYKGKFPYSWCVSRTDASNMFYNYRLNQHEPAFYFVKRKKAMDKEFSIWNIAGTVFSGEWKDKYHFFVIQVVKDSDINNKTNKQYIVTSAKNDGDKPMNWDNILEIAPELNGLQYIFTPKPLTEKERETINKYKNGLSDEEFAKLPYKEKEYYIAVYVKTDKHLTDNQFKNLPEDLKNKYVGLGVGLSDGQFDMIKDTKLLKRYADITNKKFEAFFKTEGREVDKFIFQPSEFKYLNYDMLKKGELSFIHINKLLSYSKNKDEMVKIIFNAKGDKLDSIDIRYLLFYSKNPYEIAKLIGMDKVNKALYQLNSYYIIYLLKNSQNPDEIKKLLIQAGVDRSLIPESKKTIKKVLREYTK